MNLAARCTPVRRWTLFFLLLFLPVSAAAEEAILRRDGFLLIWESIRRSLVEQSIPEFIDVQEGDLGFQEISYARDRGILDEADYFVPDDPLHLEDALLWIFRTRNVAPLDAMQKEHLSALLTQYPIADGNTDIRAMTVTQNDLFEMMRSLDQMLIDEIHEVSYYADDFHGWGTAFGESFDMHALTAAHRTFPSNTLVKVLNVENGKSVVVRINDRGPYVEGRDMDLSLAAFEKIADRSQGVLRAKFYRLGEEELVDTCTDQVRRYQKRITRDVRFHRGVPHTFIVGETLYLGANRHFVVRGIRYPDGSFIRIQDWVWPQERFSFAPPAEGEYIFTVGTKEGRVREMRMEVHNCPVSGS